MTTKMFVTLNTAAGAHYHYGAEAVMVEGVKTPTIADRAKWGFGEAELGGEIGSQRESEPLLVLTEHETPYSFARVDIQADCSLVVTREEWERVKPLIQPRYGARKRLFDGFRARGIRAIGKLRYYDWIVVFKDGDDRADFRCSTTLWFERWGLSRTVDVEPLYDTDGSLYDPYHETVDWPFRRAHAQKADSLPFDTESEVAKVIEAHYGVRREDLGIIIDLSDPRVAVPEGETLTWRRTYCGGRRSCTVGEFLTHALELEKGKVFFPNLGDFLENILPQFLPGRMIEVFYKRERGGCWVVVTQHEDWDRMELQFQYTSTNE